MGFCLFFQIHKNNCGAPLNDAPLCRGDRTRTCDSLVPNQERYQLRYTSLQDSKLFPFVLRLQRYYFFLSLTNFSSVILKYFAL